MPAALPDSRYTKRTTTGAVQVVIDRRTDELCVAYDGPAPTDEFLKLAVDNGLTECTTSESGVHTWLFLVQGTSLADPADLGREERAAALVEAARLATLEQQADLPGLDRSLAK